MSHVLMNFILAHWFSFHVTMPRRPLCFETGNINSMVFFIDFFTAWIATTIEAIFSPPSSSFHACILSRRVFSHEWTPSTTSLPPPFTTGLPLHYDSCVGEPVGSLVGSFFSRRWCHPLFFGSAATKIMVLSVLALFERMHSPDAIENSVPPPFTTSLHHRFSTPNWCMCLPFSCPFHPLALDKDHNFSGNVGTKAIDRYKSSVNKYTSCPRTVYTELFTPHCTWKKHDQRWCIHTVWCNACQCGPCSLWRATESYVYENQVLDVGILFCHLPHMNLSFLFSFLHLFVFHLVYNACTNLLFFLNIFLLVKFQKSKLNTPKKHTIHWQWPSFIS